MEKIRIAVVDSQRLFRQGLAVLFEATDDIEVVMEAGDGKTFLDLLFTGSNNVNVALIDGGLPNMDGIALAKLLQQLYPHIKVIILWTNPSRQLFEKAGTINVAGNISKNSSADALAAAVRSVKALGFYKEDSETPVNAAEEKANDAVTKLPVKLTPRELQLLDLICREYSNAEIAAELFLSVRTIEGHRDKLISKIGCHNTAGIVLFAIKHNLFKVPGDN